ncbi:uncharacterized protein LOC129916013 [Episyrphus balteatus]|uniref:uncharacterized protein LOC129916013 n=1 Tax=Episyrphus balteatus TaxID=286459 RepID=UPI0024866222|nr:uncharacterized protein LOC129916013 [Episyrphus balteatus]
MSSLNLNNYLKCYRRRKNFLKKLRNSVQPVNNIQQNHRNLFGNWSNINFYIRPKSSRNCSLSGKNIITNEPNIIPQSNEILMNSVSNDVDLPNEGEVLQFLKSNSKEANVLKYCLAGVSNIINQNMASTEASIQEMKNTVEYLGGEVFALQRIIKSEPLTISKVKEEKRSMVFNSGAEEWVASEYSEGLSFPRLPITSIDVLNRFNEELSEDDYFQKATEYILSKLKLVKNTTKQFTRRTQLKSMLFSESLLRTCSWKIAVAKKPHKFFKLSAVLSLFISVVNANVDQEIDLNGTQKYFRDLLKRKQNVEPKVAKKKKLNTNLDK